jgi:transcriptional antiterminator RfaH
MSVIDEVPALWPKSLFQEKFGLQCSGFWWAYQVAPRAEKAVARHLRSCDVSYFLPQYERCKRYQRRLVRSYLPLFPGYIFVLRTDFDLERAAESKQIVRALTIVDQLRFERELRDVYRLLQTRQPVMVEQRLPEGGPVQILSGALAGLCGRVIRKEGGLRFVSHVQFLKQGVSIEVDDTMIAPISTD